MAFSDHSAYRKAIAISLAALEDAANANTVEKVKAYSELAAAAARLAEATKG